MHPARDRTKTTESREYSTTELFDDYHPPFERVRDNCFCLPPCRPSGIA